MNPFLKRQKKSNIGDVGRSSEKRTAKRLNGKQTPASGAIDGAKGDFHLSEFLVEAKSTVKDSISIKYEWFKKIAGEALGQRKYPAVSITFTTGDGTPRDRGNWVALPEHVFKELINE